MPVAPTASPPRCITLQPRHPLASRSSPRRAGGAENMALDEALMERARATGEWVTASLLLEHADDLAGTKSVGARPATTSSAFGAARLRRRPAADRRARDPPPSRDHVQRHGAVRRRRRPPTVVRSHQPSSPRRRSLARRPRVGRQLRRRARRSPGMTSLLRRAGGRRAHRWTAASSPAARSGAPMARLLQHGSILIEDDQSLLATLAIDGGSLSPPRRRLPKRWDMRPVSTILLSRSARRSRSSKVSVPTDIHRSTMRCVPEIGSRRPLPRPSLDLASMMPRSPVVPICARPASTHAPIRSAARFGHRARRLQSKEKAASHPSGETTAEH